MCDSYETVRPVLERLVATAHQSIGVLSDGSRQEVIRVVEYSLLAPERSQAFLRIVKNVTKGQYQVFESIEDRLGPILAHGLGCLSDTELTLFCLDPAAFVAVAASVFDRMTDYWLSRLDELDEANSDQEAAELN